LLGHLPAHKKAPLPLGTDLRAAGRNFSFPASSAAPARYRNLVLPFGNFQPVSLCLSRSLMLRLPACFR
jgi:hypothetical protein